MNRFFTLPFLGLIVVLSLSSFRSTAQCFNVSAYGGGVAPAPGNSIITTGCQFAGEYASVSSVTLGNTYYSISTVPSDYFTVRSGAANGPVVAMGQTPLVWTANTSGNYYIHCNSNSACGVDYSCRNTYLGCMGPACLNTAAYGSTVAPAYGNSVTVSTCNYAGEYAIVSSVVAGNIYVSSSSVLTDYFTIRSGTSSGPVVATGLSPLTWTAMVSGNHYVHINANSSCSASAVCRNNYLSNIGNLPPANDPCFGAIPLSVGSVSAGTTLFSTVETPTAPTCVVTNTQPGVWYTVTGTGNRMGASLCSSSLWDSKILVYTGSCGSFTCLTGNDDNGPLCSGAAASATWCSQAGVAYRILVAGKTTPGSFTIAITQTVDINAVASPSVICPGGSATLIASGGTTYTWTNTGATTSSIVVTPGPSTTYTVRGNTALCASVRTLNITVSTLPVIAVNSGTICSGKVFTMNPTGASTYTYSSGSNTVSPAVPTSYTVTGSNSLGCVTASPVISFVNVYGLPVVSVSSASICSGSSYAIQMSGASNYTIIGGPNPVSPSVTTSYSVFGVNLLGCVSLPAISTITVHPIPNISLAAFPGFAICRNSSINLTAFGASSYTWNTVTTGNNITLTPSVTTSYFVVGTGTNGCTRTTIFQVTVNPIPTVSAFASKNFVCVGASVTFSALGSGNYTWNPGGSTANPFVAYPLTSTIYSVTNSNSFACTSTYTLSVEVNTITLVLSPDTTICPGGSAVLSAAGMSSQFWNTSSTFAQITVSPALTSTYTVQGTDSKGCTHAGSIKVTVRPEPVVVSFIDPPVLCAGENATITLSGASSYSWSNGNSGPTFTLNAVSSGTLNYPLKATSADGCTVSTNVYVVVDKCVGLNAPERGLAGLNVFPNPNSGLFVVELPNGTNKHITVYDVMGRAVFSLQSKKDETTIDLRDFANGVYYLRISSDNKTEVLRVVKQ